MCGSASLFISLFKKILLLPIFLVLTIFSPALKADYVFQTVTGEAFDTVTTDVVWGNDPANTGFPIDDDFQVVNIGFSFSLGETEYTSVRILSNGALHFGDNQGFHKDYTNEALPITSFFNGPGFEEAADRVIAGYWDDLEPLTGGTVRYDTLGTAPNRRFVVSWEDVPRFDEPTTSYSLQIVLYENGNIRFRYGDDEVDGTSATIGIEVDNTDFTEFSFNTNSVSDANDLLWIREFPTLSSASSDCANDNIVMVNFSAAVSPSRANDPSNFSIDNGITVTGATYINATTVELTTTSLSTGVDYTLSSTFPNQSVTFQMSTSLNETIGDNFSTVSYANNDGSQNWTTNWIETDDDGLVGSGRVGIFNNNLGLTNRSGPNADPSVEREADLSDATTASLSVDLDTSGTLENGDRFDISVSSNGGASWSLLQNFINDVDNTFTYDISSFASENFRVRLRINQGYRSNNEFILIDNVTISYESSTACITVTNHFRFIHDGSGINCLREAITLRAEDASNNLVTDYSGLVNLSLSTNNGNWYVNDESGSSSDSAQGVLTDTNGDNNGVATYQFNAADNGAVVLYLQNTVAEVTNVNAAVGSISDDNSEGNITFRPFGFTFSPSPINTQIAGRPFDITLTAAGQTPSDNECGIIEEYNGDKQVNFWSEFSIPNSSTTSVQVDTTNIANSESVSSAQLVNFSNGVATISVQYNDVGEISIHAKDEIDLGEPPTGNVDEIIGGISPFVVRPFAFHIGIDGEPDATDENSPIYRDAGESFDTTLSSVIWQLADDADNDGQADINADLSDNNTTPNISLISGNVDITNTAQVVTRSNGIIADTNVDFSEFAAAGTAQEGVATVTQSWDEVGILQLNALSSNFMSTTEDINGVRANIGRFIPASFLLTPQDITNQCGTFTYMGFWDSVNAGLDRNGQVFDIQGTIAALNTGGSVTQNYSGVFAKILPSDFDLQPFDDDLSANATGRVNSTAINLNFDQAGSYGVSDYAFNSADYQHNTLAAPINLSINLTATDPDEDNTTSGTVSSNIFEVRLGRARLIDSYGSELSDLEMPINTDYFNGSDWLLNTDDTCTQYIQTDVSLLASSYTDNLNDGETSTFAPTSIQNLVNGSSSLGNGFWFDAPGENNYGSVLVELDLSSRTWLQFDWDSDNTIDPPSALLSFGYYRGSDRVIYWREVRN